MMPPVTVQSVGIDIADIRRFRKASMRRGERFIRNTFTEKECDYCFAYRDPAPHLAGTFAAKEAVRKVYGDTAMQLSDIEVRHRPSGKPEIWLKGKRSPTVLISITHNASVAIAVAVKNTP